MKLRYELRVTLRRDDGTEWINRSRSRARAALEAKAAAWIGCTDEDHHYVSHVIVDHETVTGVTDPAKAPE